MKTFSIILSIIALCICSFILGTKYYNQYDVNRDGKVNAVDYVNLKNYIMEVNNE